MSTNRKSELFGFNILIFNYIIIAAIFILGAMLFFGQRSPQQHQDQQAVNAVKQVVASFRPVSMIQSRFQNEQQLQCEQTAIGEQLRDLELQLALLAGKDEQGKVSGNYRLAEHLAIDMAVLGQQKLNCDELNRGLRLLLSQNGLASLNWVNETVASRTKQGKSLNAAWATVPKYGFIRGNPWGGLPGCVTFGGYYLDNKRNGYCANIPALALKPSSEQAEVVPHSLANMLTDIEAFRAPSSFYYRQLTENQPNQIIQPNSDHQQDVGFHLRLTLNPNSQKLAQQVAECYAGKTSACEALSIPSNVGEAYYEQAAVRMTGVAIIDIPTGKIEALASADSPCYQQQYDGPGRDSGCPSVPRIPRYRPNMLLNHAVYTDAMPASTVKALLALGLVSTENYGISQGQLTQELKTSNSAAFLNHLFCIDGACNQSGALSYSPRLFNSQQAAIAAGWNQNCTKNSSLCGVNDILFGRNAKEKIDSNIGHVLPIGTRVLYGRMFIDEHQQLMSARDFSFNADNARECASKKWRQCRGNAVTNTASEAWGQGNARASVLGVAGMFARIAAAANGQTSQRNPYLLDSVLNANGQKLNAAILAAAPAEAITIPQHQAERVITGMSQSHQRGGTAASACVSAGLKNCDAINWISGKTGTPPFGFDQVTLDEINKLCATPSKQNMARCNSEIPYKWYAAAFKSNPNSPQYDKAIAVLSERNWYLSGKHAGKVDAPGDTGRNVSAEIAFRIMDRIHQ